MTRWLFENIFTILLLVLMGTSSYMLKTTLEDLQQSVDRLAEVSETQNVRLESHGTQLDQLHGDVDRLEERIQKHSERWTELYRGDANDQ